MDKDINDLKAYANAIGVKCENCHFFIFRKSGWCSKKAAISEKNDFCKNFEKKETNG